MHTSVLRSTLAILIVSAAHTPHTHLGVFICCAGTPASPHMVRCINPGDQSWLLQPVLGRVAGEAGQ
jgi:hypothetical protein